MDEIAESLEAMIEYASDYFAYKKESLNHPRNYPEFKLIEQDIEKARKVLDDIISKS